MLVACAAVLAHGAVAKWSVMNIQSSPDVAVGAGWLVCLYEGNSSNYSHDDALAGTLAAANSQNTVLNSSNGTYYINNSTGFGDFENGSEHTFYAVIYDASSIADAKNYIVSADVTKSFNISGSPQSWAFGNMALTTTGNKFSTASGGAGWQSVPEPTSGILLLVGGALLALRRKRK